MDHAEGAGTLQLRLEEKRNLRLPRHSVLLPLYSNNALRARIALAEILARDLSGRMVARGFEHRAQHVLHRIQRACVQLLKRHGGKWNRDAAPSKSALCRARCGNERVAD